MGKADQRERLMLTNYKTMVSLARFIALAAALLLAAPYPALAAKGNPENGEKIYMKKCWWCHGKEGEADGPGADFMMPPPRDFSMGVYKYKTSPPDRWIPRDEDLFAMISNGMPGTSMPKWGDILNEQERWDLVAFIKTLTDMFEDNPNPPEISYGTKVASSPESIEKGKKLFKDAKCYECHGEQGRGDTIKKLKEDSGAKLWPRNLAKPWTFRGGYTPEAVFARITNGIPNTPMPAHAAEKTGAGKLSVEDRWHVVNYVMSLADPTRQVIEGDIVIRGLQMEQLPKDENDPAWEGIESTAFRLVPQIIQKERFFTPANDLISAKAAFTNDEVAFLLLVDDRTKSIVGDNIAAGLAWGELKSDAVAIQFPVEIPDSSEKPYFGHGDGSHPVNMLYWSSGSVDKQNVGMTLTATGSGTREPSDAAAAGFTTSATYDNGTWKVMMKRKLTTPNADKDIQFEVGKYIPIAFANWDGSNGEGGSKHTLTTWRWLLLKPETGSEVVMIPAAVFAILVIVQFGFAITGRKKSV